MSWCQRAQLCQEESARGQLFKAFNEIKTEDVDTSVQKTLKGFETGAEKLLDDLNVGFWY